MKSEECQVHVKSPREETEQPEPLEGVYGEGWPKVKLEDVVGKSWLDDMGTLKGVVTEAKTK